MMDRMASNSKAEFDVELANKLAHLESYNKHLYRPNSYLHKWWARRCGSTFRLILKSLVEVDSSRDYYAPGGLEGRVILDPMLGGGTTLHEAIRLGANVIGFDVDPIPVLQAKATLSAESLSSLESAFSSLFGELERELAPFYVTYCSECGSHHPVRYYLYGLRQLCDCGEAIIVDSLVLRQDRSGSAIRLCEKCRGVLRDSKTCDCSASGKGIPLYEKTTKHCPECGARFRGSFEVPYYRRYRPLVAVAECQLQKLAFLPITAADTSLLERADSLRSELMFSESTMVKPGAKSDDLLKRGIDDYKDLFSTRQLLYLKTAIGAMRQFEPRIRLYLSLLVSTSLEFNVMLCGYKGAGVRRAGAVRHAFSHHAYSFPYTAVENNPIHDSRGSGTLRKLFHDRVRRARRWSRRPKERSLDPNGPRFVPIDGEIDFGHEASEFAALSGDGHSFLIRQGSAADTGLPDQSIDYVVTDPPYYDSVQYGNLSGFFRVWLRQMLNGEVAGDIRWDYVASESAVMMGEDGQKDHYLETMSAIFHECRRVLKPTHGRLMFSFHHWRAAGWEAISIALKRARFELLARYVVHAENPSSVHISNLNALTDDAILVLAAKDCASPKHWPRPRSIRTSSSAEFCLDCADALGWILEAKMTESEITAWWQRQLEGQAGRE